MSPEVAAWRQSGKVSFWRYASTTRNLRDSWHLSADEAGLADLMGLIDLFRRAPYPSRVQLHLTGDIRPDPMSAPEVLRPASALVLSYRAEWPGDLWRITDRTEDVLFEFGEDMLATVEAGLTELRDREGDFAIGGSSQGWPLWLWPWPSRR